MIPAICVIPSGGIGMLHACICGPSVLGNSHRTVWKQHGLRRLWHTAVGCQTCAAGYASFKNGTSNQNSSPKSEKDVSGPLCNYCLHHLSATFLNIVKLVVGSRMKMLQEMYVIWSEDKRALVEKWAKQQIAQNYFNCTMMPSSDSRLRKSMAVGYFITWSLLEGEGALSSVFHLKGTLKWTLSCCIYQRGIPGRHFCGIFFKHGATGVILQ